MGPHAHVPLLPLLQRPHGTHELCRLLHLALHRGHGALPTLPALEVPPHGASHQGQPVLPHPLPPPHRHHPPSAHDCQACGDGHRVCHDPRLRPRLHRVHHVEEQAVVGEAHPW